MGNLLIFPQTECIICSMGLCRNFTKYFPVSRFLRLSRSQDINFYLEKWRQKVWKFINCMLKDIMSTKTMKELCVSQQFSFVFGCKLSASAGNLLKFFSHYFKNWQMQEICHAGNWKEITVILTPTFTFICYF